MLEACLESHGVNVKDLHTPPVDVSTELCYNTATSRGPMRMDSHMRRNSGKYRPIPGCANWMRTVYEAHLSPQIAGSDAYIV